jgi:Tfp pilus assembly protein PilN
MKRRIDLLPAAERARAGNESALLIMVAIAVVVVIGLGLGYYLLDEHRDTQQKQLVEIQRQVVHVEQQVAALENYEQLKTKRSKSEATIAALYGAQTSFSNLLTELSLVIPENVWFQRLGIVAPDPVPAGMQPLERDALSADATIDIEATAYSYDDVADTIVRLQLIPGVRDVELVSAAAADETKFPQRVKTFTVHGSLYDVDPMASLPMDDVQVEAQ